jgi:hypothetical protein
MSTLILIHNIDTMNQERNMVESIISTCICFSGKTKDDTTGFGFVFLFLLCVHYVYLTLS